MIQKHDLLPILQTLIRMRTCAPTGDEYDIVRYIESLFAPYNVYKYVLQHEQNRSTLVVGINGEKRSERVKGIMGHIDTMPPYNPSGWTYGPFSGHYVDGKVYGVGASNAKSGVAAVLAATLELLKRGEKPIHDIMLYFTADSDGQGIGAKTLLQSGFLANIKEIVFCDPTGSYISIAQKGTIWISVVVKGRGKHVMEASPTENVLNGLISFCGKLSSKFNKIRKHDILGNCSVNLTQINTSHNAIWMIPEEAKGCIDIRITPYVDINEAYAIIEETQKCVEATSRGLSITVEVLNKRHGVGMSPDAPFIQRFVDIYKLHGRAPKFIGQSFYTDASSIIPTLGIPFLVIGPGEKSFNDHEDEHVLLDDVMFISNVYYDYIKGE